MSNRTWTVLAVLAALGLTSAADAHDRNRDVTVQVIDARGASFGEFPVNDGGSAYRAYLQAERNAPYRIRICNRTGQRVGVVVAVDGRNIVSGAQSELARTEQMYVLGPWETQEYSGWRTSLTDVHEFYFTEWKDSYAEAFGDRSARGVIAVAVYRELQHYQPKLSQRYENEDKAASRARDAQAPAPSTQSGAVGELARSKDEKRDAEPGTGFGDQRYEPATRVEFEAERRASARVFLKYEWQETLCRKGIVDCAQDKNRFWKDDLAFAPFAPGRAR